MQGSDEPTLAERANLVPALAFPEDLPVSAARERITQALRAHQVIVVCGDTGSGKTTQLPKICLAAGRGLAGMIGHTQPRRIAARSVAARIAEETGTVLGHQVGYKVRFNDVTAADTLVKLMTDGILLAEIQQDPELRAYDTLIVDEAHERSLNIDFLLGYLRRLLPRRPDLKLIITSATIDPQRFSRHFDEAPVISVEGRTHPVTVEYRPPDRDGVLPEQVLEAVRALASRPATALGGGSHRDMLVFLPGERFIRETEQLLRRQGPRGYEILPLYGRLPGGQQDRIFHPGEAPRIVLATNVAETSLTVPRIRYVIDSGLARISRYSPRSKIQRLPIEPVSQASAEQRKGRCGRLAPGLCLRLYDEADLAARPEFTDSEILRTSLASVILQMEALGLGAIEEFPFLESPPLAAVRDGYRLLEELGAVDAERHITPTGRRMARLPLDPRLARMLLAGADTGALREVLIIVAGLAVQDPRERPPERTAEADACHAALSDPRSDFLFYLNLWQRLRALEKDRAGSSLRRWCRDNHLSWLRVREWQDVHLQLTDQCRTLHLHMNRQPGGYSAIHRALLTGLLGMIARQERGREYRGVRDGRYLLFPGSALTRRPPPWIVAAEIVETSRVYALTAAKVTAGWIEEAAGPLVRRSHEEAWYDARAGQVMCRERVTLWGLPLLSGRRVPLASHDPAAARALFVEEALVGQQLRRAPGVVRANWQLRSELETLEARLRRRDLVIGERAEAVLWDQRLPPGVVDARSLEQALQRKRHAADALRLVREDLALRQLGPLELAGFPDHLDLQGNALPLVYRYTPGSADDGVTLQLPMALLPGLDDARLSWLVPGYRTARIEARLRQLPKANRRLVVPVPDTARVLAAEQPGEVVPAGVSLEQWLAGVLAERYGVAMEPAVWESSPLPPELLFNLQVLDGGGEVLGEGRDLRELKRRFAATDPGARRLGQAQWERDGLRDWDFAELPEEVIVQQGSLRLTLYPALVDRGASVSMRLLDTPQAAAAANRAGVLRLAMLRLGDQRRLLEQGVRRDRELALRYRGLGRAEDLVADVLGAGFADALLPAAEPLPRTREAFEARLRAAAAVVVPRTEAVVAQLREILALHTEIVRRLRQQRLPAMAALDVTAQLEGLVGPRMLSTTPPRWRARLPVYLQAIVLRLDKLAHGHPRDAEYTAEIQRQWQRIEQWQARRPDTPVPAALIEFRWLVEELRVSLFAQQLGTLLRISARRLDERWQALVAGTASPGG